MGSPLFTAAGSYHRRTSPGWTGSLMCYPRFFENPHPALRHAVTIDLVSGKARHTDYAGNPNPPILHRKESLLPAEHPQRGEFEELTRQEEAAGLYEQTNDRVQVELGPAAGGQGSGDRGAQVAKDATS